MARHAQRVEAELEAEEHFHFERVVGSFTGYERAVAADARRTERAAARLAPELARLLPPGCLARRAAGLRAAAAANGQFLRAVVAGRGAFGPPGEDPRAGAAPHPRAQPREDDFGKVRSTLHSCVRDWSSEGAAERAACYGPILEELERVVPRDGATRVLVPGAGLARLVLEVAARGYVAQGNEFSYHMLLCSNFLLNSDLRPNELALYPFIDQPSNCRVAGDRLRGVRVPDVVPSALLKRGGSPDFSMAAGEFLDVYRDQCETWDAVAACFFVDTAPVALEYLEAIWRLLKPGGAWVNLGPLLYHWVPSSSYDLEGGLDAHGRPCAGADDRYVRALEFSWDELRHAIVARGFEIVKEEWRHCTYTANARSMMRTDYDCIFFTARKPAGAPGGKSPQ
jgi:carnosine N-methyltransferase